MIGQKEFVSPAGLRVDGRRAEELRPISIKFNVRNDCDGSCELVWGKTKIVASVIGPQNVISNRLEKGTDAADVSCSVRLGAYSNNNRQHAQHRGRLSEDISSAVLEVVRSMVFLQQYPNSHIFLSLEVITIDGSEKVASINAACLALICANVAMSDVICAIDVGIFDDNILVDLTSEELHAKCPIASIVVKGHETNSIVWLHSSTRSTTNDIERMLSYAIKVTHKMFTDVIEPYLRNHGSANLY